MAYYRDKATIIKSEEVPEMPLVGVRSLLAKRSFADRVVAVEASCAVYLVRRRFSDLLVLFRPAVHAPSTVTTTIP